MPRVLSCGLGFDDADAIILEIRFGEGGEDSKDFVVELFGAYCRYATANRLRVEPLDTDRGHIVAKVSGPGAFRLFKHETGQHACQRVPRTERNGRRHTSMVGVAVLPIPENVWQPLPASEMEVTAQCGRLTAGGQNAQKNATAIRAVHRPTGITVFIQNERSQEQNRREAIRILTARVNDDRQAKADGEYAKFKREQLGDGRRGAKIRTYNFIDCRAVDHRLGRKTPKVDDVMRGRFDLLIR